MTEAETLYNTQADKYERLVSREDYQQNITPALNQIRPLAGLEVVELGAGTGRLTRLLAPIVRSMRAFDVAQPMLDVARAKLQKSASQNWALGVADNRNLPLKGQSADIVISGWSICYTIVWHPDNWRAELGKALFEMKRVLRPGGAIILLEDVDEYPYRIDRMLNQLRLAGILAGAGGLVFGPFRDCFTAAEMEQSPTLEQIVSDLTDGVEIPIVTGFPYGHLPRRLVLPIGVRASLDTADPPHLSIEAAALAA